MSMTGLKSGARTLSNNFRALVLVYKYFNTELYCSIELAKKLQSLNYSNNAEKLGLCEFDF